MTWFESNKVEDLSNKSIIFILAYGAKECYNTMYRDEYSEFNTLAMNRVRVMF